MQVPKALSPSGLSIDINNWMQHLGAHRNYRDLSRVFREEGPRAAESCAAALAGAAVASLLSHALSRVSMSGMSVCTVVWLDACADVCDAASCLHVRACVYVRLRVSACVYQYVGARVLCVFVCVKPLSMCLFVCF